MKFIKTSGSQMGQKKKIQIRLNILKAKNERKKQQQ